MSAPSKAARELAEKVNLELIDMCHESVPQFEPQLAEMIQSALSNLLEKAERADTLLRLFPPTIRRVLDAGDKAISAAGLNPWCMNEGLATGDETIDFDLSGTLEPWKAE